MRRILSLIMALAFLPVGILIIVSAYSLSSPHLFVMFIFSGSLVVMLGLVGVIGVLAGKVAKEETETDD